MDKSYGRVKHITSNGRDMTKNDTEKQRRLAEALRANLTALIEALNRAKPSSSKGIYLRKVALSSTMGAGVKVDTASVLAPSA